MTKTLLSGGVIAGAFAGLAVALLQFFLIQPLIVEAERYETGELVLTGMENVGTAGEPAEPDMSAHEADGAGGEDSVLMRNGLTVLTLILTWSGFGLMAGAGLTTFRAMPGGRTISVPALALSGFAAFALSPGMGLPPELPGMQAADLSDRQGWWVMTAVTTTAGLFLAGSVRTWPGRIAGLILIVAPHLYGAPPPPLSVPTVPPDLSALYGARILGVNLIGWLVLATLLFRLLPKGGGKRPMAIAGLADTS